jgi:hypothetical protein
MSQRRRISEVSHRIRMRTQILFYHEQPNLGIDSILANHHWQYATAEAGRTLIAAFSARIW